VYAYCLWLPRQCQNLEAFWMLLGEVPSPCWLSFVRHISTWNFATKVKTTKIGFKGATFFLKVEKFNFDFIFLHLGKFQHGNEHIAGFSCLLAFWEALLRRTLLVKIYFTQKSHYLVGGLEPEILKLVADLMDKKNAMYFYYLHKSSQQRINSRETLFFFSSKWKWWHLLYGSDSLFITRSWKIRTICNYYEICFWRNSICVRTNSLCPIRTGKTIANINRKWSSVEN